ncbi:hypothetical protein [Persicobacter psychrovividus]|uniref:Uncharacterized protein n=1 Tax=Persicobacter psychrovividus TaxID=387638 RepID=A0ABM7VE98_9BACT|nr:hypothetical protein PEPS_15740 [Persicobacter psychrovividus]
MKLVHINENGVRFYAMAGNLFAIANIDSQSTVSTCLSFTNLSESRLDHMDAKEVRKLQQDFGKA